MTVINTLADHAFKHRIILSDKTVLYIIVFTLYLFNCWINSWYNYFEFKEWLIDSEALTRSTEDIGQLKALQQLDISVSLDKNIVGWANLTFVIGNATSIRSVNLDTPLGPITFQIVLIYTLFLLYLAHMDKNGAFFKNNTNQIIQSQT